MKDEKRSLKQSRVIGVILRISKNFHSYCEERLKPYGLTNGIYYYLIHIYKNPGEKANELSKTFDVDKAHMSRALKKLSELGYVKKTTDEKDRKSFKIYPTDKCGEVIGEIEDIVSDWEKAAVSGVEDADIEFAREVAEKMFKNVDGLDF